MPVASWFSPLVEIRPSGIQGFGLFATQDIPALTHVVTKNGSILTWAEIIRLGQAAEGAWLQIAADQFIGPATPDERKPSMTRVNHSCDPRRVNLGMRGDIKGFARRDISAGEELFYDYGTIVAVSGWSMPCQCRYTSCRRTITGNDWKSRFFQLRHEGWFTDYIRSLFDMAA